MKYKKNDKLFYENNKTKEVSEVEIIDIKYVFNKRIGQTNMLTEEQIDEYISEGKLSKTKEAYINKRIKDLEQELGIELERK